jgi:DNA-binding transcriptional regulator YiaG
MHSTLTKEVHLQPQSLLESGYYARIIRDLRETALTTTEIGAITRVKERQVQNWAAGSNKPNAPARDRLLEVAYIVGELRNVYAPEGIDIWIHGRNKSLGGQRPIDLLINGDFPTVLNAVERLTTGAM